MVLATRFVLCGALLLGLARAQRNSSSTTAESASSESASSESTSATALASSSKLNGWYSCTEFTFADDANGESLEDAECAIYTAPLCYSDICDDPKDRTVDVFVKRIPAMEDPDSQPNVWFLQGGPGAGSTASTSIVRM